MGDKMSFKSILAALAPTEDKQAGPEYAISMAQALKAHVTGASYVLDPYVRGVPWLAEDLVASHVSALVDKAKIVAEHFKDSARNAKVDSTAEVFRSSLDTATTGLSEYSRVHDITVLTETTPGLDHYGDQFIEAALFYSGRPIILVPKNYSEPFNAARTLIAWDGSQRAASAVAHAMPLLTLANRVEVMVVGDKEKVQRSRAGKLMATLELHGVDVHLICRDEEDDAGAIAREIKTWGAGLLVMGGYGRSVTREMIFGGVTRYMMTEATVPVLMAH
jgi:nucleotide-binding universal stress UspA family protein